MCPQFKSGSSHVPPQRVTKAARNGGFFFATPLPLLKLLRVLLGGAPKQVRANLFTKFIELLAFLHRLAGPLSFSGRLHSFPNLVEVDEPGA